ncbi:hypothetical protein GOODEAATRI_025543 [Goodea atripinnis]|uniref:Uncharacterized protein n=1 Tax=Goodea atripinnis TaxID=208336 RepID=A0ABV0P7R5_9TELE
MPYVETGDELIPLLMLLSLAFAGPAASVVANSLRFFHCSTCLRNEQLCTRKASGVFSFIYQSCSHLHHLFPLPVSPSGVHVFGLLATALVTDVIQLATGYHAPFFLTVCQPNYTAPGVSCDNNAYITQDICMGKDQYAIMSAR